MPRGFAGMDPAKQKEIASKGGRAAHAKGTAHEWTSEEARAAGRKGGASTHRTRGRQRADGAAAAPETTGTGTSPTSPTV